MPLFVVATPIGNLSDLSPRGRTVLTQAAVVLCEDTRRTRRLYAGLGLPAPRLVSCHSHNESSRVDAVVAQVAAGEIVALVSDAGTPGLSDPGGVVVSAVLAAGLPVRVVPGPSAIAAALSASGFPATPHHFLGFPPRKQGELLRFLTDASRLPGPLVMLESGRRLGKLIAALQTLMPGREACICRELTKIHEEVIRGPVEELPAEARPGEVVVVLGSGDAVTAAAPVQSGTGLKAAAALLAPRWGCTRREAYQRLLAVEASNP
ncbi:MAG: ribosomal RNA small subunit methyltransferase I [Myxococcota bacterium]|nr:ribosomal RNA small subunit methyltransferase I [Myxococcota bacterium]